MIQALQNMYHAENDMLLVAVSVKMSRDDACHETEQCYRTLDIILQSLVSN